MEEKYPWFSRDSDTEIHVHEVVASLVILKYEGRVLEFYLRMREIILELFFHA